MESLLYAFVHLWLRLLIGWFATFRDDPTILAWSLANEPRCEGDFSGSSLQVFSQWQLFIQLAGCK